MQVRHRLLSQRPYLRPRFRRVHHRWPDPRSRQVRIRHRRHGGPGRRLARLDSRCHRPDGCTRHRPTTARRGGDGFNLRPPAPGRDTRVHRRPNVSARRRRIRSRRRGPAGCRLRIQPRRRRITVHRRPFGYRPRWTRPRSPTATCTLHSPAGGEQCTRRRPGTLIPANHVRSDGRRICSPRSVNRSSATSESRFCRSRVESERPRPQWVWDPHWRWCGTIG